MKKLLFFAAIALCSLKGLQAQEKSNAIKFNPLSFLGGVDLLSYERVIGEKSSVVLGGGYGGFKLGDVKYNSTGVMLQYRMYFSEALDGWYGGANVQYRGGKVEVGHSSFSFDDNTTSDSEELKFNSFGGGIKIGHQWAWNSGFTLDLNLGVNYSSFSYDLNEGQENFYEDTLEGGGTLPTFGFALGYAW